MAIDDFTTRAGPGPLSADPSKSTAGPEAPRSIERRDRVRPETDSLPGNIGWTRMLLDAATSRFDKIRAWATTSADRLDATFGTMGASVARAQQRTFERRADKYSSRQSRHDAALARLEAKSGMWDLPIARSIKNSLVLYHSWRGSVNGGYVRRAEARASAYGRVAATADNFKAYFDDKVASRAEKIAAKWQTKLDAVRGPREKIDQQIERMSEVVSRQEQLIVRIREQLVVLESTTGGDRAARRARLQTLHRSLATEEAVLRDRQKILQGKLKHRIRLAAAEDTANDTIQSLRDRYTKRPETAAADAPAAAPETRRGAPVRATGTAEAAQTAVRAPSDTFEMNEQRTIRALAEMRPAMTNEQVGKLWDYVFYPKRLPNGFRTLVEFVRAAFPERNIPDGPEEQTSVRDFLNGLKDVYTRNPAFKTFLEDMTGQKGDRALETAVGRLETAIAFTDNIG